MARREVLAAAEGASLIVHAVNPPGYRNLVRALATTGSLKGW
jgi:hypothetical protein